MTDFRKLNAMISVSPQVTQTDIEEAARQGFKTVIINRPNGEEPGQPENAVLQAATETQGMVWLDVAICHTVGLTHQHVEDMANALANAPKPILAFCRTGTRSCNIYALAAAKNGAASPDALIEEGASCGYDLQSLKPILAELYAAAGKV